MWSRIWTETAPKTTTMTTLTVMVDQCGGTGVQFRPMGCELEQPPTQRYQCQQPDYRRELAIGTEIGEFNATDPDGETNITFSLVPPLPSDLNLSLWLDASDASTVTHSNGSVSQWADKSGNGNHAVRILKRENHLSVQ